MRLPERPIRNLLHLLFLVVGVGCSSSSKGSAPGLVLLVPGAGGDGAWYRHVVPALREAGDRRSVESVRWGVAGPGFFANFNSVSIHNAAEQKLADRIMAYRQDHPFDRLDILAHSAGGGVALGALCRLPLGVKVDGVVLLHPSVSPGYPLAPALEAVREPLHLFYSDRDATFLSWRTSHFGTYDNVKTKAAGHCGFNVATLPPALLSRLIQHAWTSDAAKLGNDGGHFAVLARPFLVQRVIPIIATSQSALR